ncbi:hypothetical protein C6I20_09350 [Aeromicrobium sp. A1-2]|uniref:hypothetical protein n=1 Tax=Aeromicrobium sp. A1-2 TaxID=2107713 RepID=UPI000E514677|nr:hypothetical protein [Aeromicrobium sp. A1-2]AXT85369.1 hypothetical protein C6I20_09350 [Aeromicrobium sp. A1-2]
MTGQNPRATRPPGRVHTIVGGVFGVMAILFFPILFGPLGAILGFMGHRKGDRPLGTYVGAGSIMTTIIGITLGAIASSVS